MPELQLVLLHLPVCSMLTTSLSSFSGGWEMGRRLGDHSQYTAVTETGEPQKQDEALVVTREPRCEYPNWISVSH